MESYNNNKPAIEQGWLRALLFVVLFFVILFGAGLLLNSFLPLDNKGIGNISASQKVLIGVLMNSVIAFLMVAGFRKFVDKKSLNSLGFETNKKFPHGAVGFLAGIVLLCIASIFLFFTKNLQWTAIHFNAKDLFLGFGLMVIVAFYEEMVFRGYLLNNLLDSVNKWTALYITAFLFALAHTNNPGITVLAFVNIFLAGLLLGVNYIFTKNLWFAIALHFSWNFFQGPVFGYEVSGLNLQSVLTPELHGSDWLTGGKFGLEGSLLSALLYLAAIGTFAFIYQKKCAPAPPA